MLQRSRSRLPRVPSPARATLLDAGVFGALAALIVGPWVGSGWLLLLDWTSGPRSTLTTGVYGLDANQADAMPARVLMAGLRAVVGPAASAWLPIAAAVVVAGVGMGRLVGGPAVRRWAAGLAFTVNPFVFERLRAGHVLLLLGFAVLPWLLSSAFTARRDGRWFRVRTALWLALAIAMSPHMFWIGTIALVAVTVVPRPTVRDVVRLVVTVVAAGVTAAYGIVVALVGARTSTIGPSHLDAFATAGAGPWDRLLEVITLHGFWRGGELPRDTLGPWWPVLLAAWVALAVVGWQALRHRPGREQWPSVLGVMIAAGALLGTGAGGPIGPLYRWLFDVVPMFAVMREAQKFAALVALGVAVLVGFGADELVRRFERRTPRRHVVAVAAVLLPVLLTPTLLWGLGGSVRTSEAPASWAAADRIMGDGDGAVLALPWHQYQPYDMSAGRSVRTPAAAFFGRPVITSESPELEGIPPTSNSARHAYLDQLMARVGGIEHFGRLVAPLGVQFVVVTTTAAERRLPTWLDDQVDLVERYRTDDLVLYENLAAGTGRVSGMRTVASFDDYLDLVETGRVTDEAILLDPTGATAGTRGGRSTPVATVDRPTLRVQSPTRFRLDAGDPGWAVVPTPAVRGWMVGDTAGRQTLHGVLAFPVGSEATTVVYTPWSAVRLGYLLSIGGALALVGIGLVEHRRQLRAHRWLRHATTTLGAGMTRFRRGVGPAYLGAWAVAVICVNQWFVPGAFIATGDMAPFIRRGWQPEAWWSWNHAITGAGSATYVMARWYELFLSDAVLGLGGTDTLAQRLLYLTIYPMVALAVAAVAGAFTRNRWAIFAAGCFGVLNGFFLTRLPNPLNIISVGSTALVAALGWRIAQGRRFPAPLLGLTMLPMSFLAYNPPMLTVALVWTAIGVPLVATVIWGWAALGRIIRYAVSAAPWALLINVFWMVPFAQAFGGGGGAAATAQTDPTAWAWSQAQNSIPNVFNLSANWAWYKPQYLPFTPALDQPWWIWLRYVLPVVLVLAPLVALPRRRRAALSLLTLVVVFTVLGKGLQPPFGGLNRMLYAYVPGFWLFREPMSKLGQLLIMFDAVLIALAIEGTLTRLRGRPRLVAWPGRSALAISIVAILAWPYPLITGSVIPDVRPKQPPAHVVVPDYWRSTAALIDADPAPGKVLVLPLNDYYQMPTTWGFAGSDTIAGLLIQRPVIQRKPDGYFGDTPGMAAQAEQVERALVTGDLDAVQPLLHQMGVSHVIVRHDLQVGDPLRTFADPDLLAAAVARVDGLEAVQRASLDVYRTTAGSSPTVRAARDPLVVPGTADAVAAAVASLPVGTPVLGDPEAASGELPDAVPGPDAVSAADGVWWPVPAVEEGEATTTFTTTGGRFTVHQRSRAAIPLVPAEVTAPGASSGVELQLADPTVVVIDDEPVSLRSTTSYPLTRPGVVAVTAGDRTVSLDGWRSADLPAGSSGAGGPPTVPIGAATPLTAWAPTDEQPQLTPFTDVYDCNNYEPRPQSELGLEVDYRLIDQQEVVELSARDHAACVATTIDGVSGGDGVRLRIEYRTETGKRPQVCLLEVFADGSNSCVPDARLRADDTWGRYELVHRLADDAVSAKVVLYANVGLRLSPPTVSQYRGLTVERLEPALETLAWPPPVEPVTIELSPGEHTMRLAGGAYGSILEPFEPLEDCFRYDDLTVDEAGLASSTSIDESGATVYELRAKDHMACIAAAMPDNGGNGLYTLRYDYRSVAIRKPRICLYQRGPNICEPLPANGSETEWATYERLVRPRLPVLESRLYLYGTRDLAGRRQAIVQYRDVRVTPNASSTAVLLLRATELPDEPLDVATTELSWERRNPATFSVAMPRLTDGTIISLAETWAPAWTLTGLPEGVTAEKLRVNGHQNGWRIVGDHDGPVDLRIVYPPAYRSRLALKLSIVTIVMAIAWLVVRRRVRRFAARRWTARRVLRRSS